ncbi:MAG TPA: DsbE family thiol:disulfide interchange protein [Chromatiaceae bacterium]|nr:DsbE family thiol:disulfide interchange protein [Chromatiaceae bacterium]
MIRYLLPLGIFIVIVGFLFVGLGMDPKIVPSPFIGKPAPEFNLPKLYKPDERVATADMKGQVWLLNVWASWCVSCRAEHQVVTRFAKTGLVPIYGLNYKDEPEDAKGWLRALGNPYVASLVDYDGNAGIDWGVYGVPETFVMDKNGIVRDKVIGPVTEEIVQDRLIPLIEKLQAEEG